MEGMCGSGDLIRIEPDPNKLPPGYVYAFLASRYGWACIRKLIFGGHIKHIEPKAVARIGVPRLGSNVEEEVHALVIEAARLRSAANKKLTEVAAVFDRMLATINVIATSPRVSYVSCRMLRKRMDAHFHEPIAMRIRDKIKSSAHTTVGDWCSDIHLPGIFKRIHIEDPQYGAPYYTGASLFWLEPIPKAILSRKTSLFDQVVMERGTVLVQAFGQEGGLLGRAVWVGEHLCQATTTHMLARLKCITPDRAAYLFGFLQSEVAYRQIACLSYGGSIPHFDTDGIASVLMPTCERAIANSIVTDTLSAVESRDQALSLDRKACRLVEETFEESK